MNTVISLRAVLRRLSFTDSQMTVIKNNSTAINHLFKLMQSDQIND